MTRALPLAMLAALAIGCASAPKLPPKASPEQVDLYNPDAGQFPPAGYKTIGPVKAEVPLSSSMQDLMTALRAEAARLGADAVILQRVTRSADADIASSREQTQIAEGLAVYWPPETSQ